MQFSDSIVLVAPLRVSAKPYYNGLEIVAMRCIQVAHIALQNGYLFRGGIDVGPIFRIGTNIAGRAFMNAYAIEKATKKPRIALSDEANRWWSENGWGADRMRVTFNRVSMVNVLHPAYVPDDGTGNRAIVPMETLESHYTRYLDIASVQTKSKELDCKARSKWRWMLNYIDYVAKMEQLQIKPHR